MYYGGYSIYKLNGVNTTNKERILTPMATTSAYNTTIENVLLYPPQKKITIAFNPYIIPKNDALSSHPLLILKIPREVIANISSVFASYGNIEKQLEFNISKVGAFFYLTIPNKYADSIRPSVNIANPPYLPSSHSSTTTKTITVNGTASDADSGIQMVEAFAHTFPFDNEFPFNPATPSSPGNWSEWSIPINITGPGYHRVLVQATDNAGNQNWTEVIVNIPSIPFTPDKVTVVSSDFKTFSVNGTASDCGSGIKK